MQITCGIATKVQRAVQRTARGRRLVEVGTRCWPDQPDDEDGFNFLRWGRDHDLFETIPIDKLVVREIKDDEGWVAFDCYVYTLGEDGELEGNVYVLLNPKGQVVYVSDDDCGHSYDIDALLKERGHRGYPSHP